ncbi:MAG: hypothetical protein ABI333_22190, partial [bacterium]
GIQQYVNDLTRDDKETPFTYDTNSENKALDMQKAGLAMLGLAGAAAVTAVVLWILRKKKVRYTAAEADKGGGVKIRF